MLNIISFWADSLWVLTKAGPSWCEVSKVALSSEETVVCLSRQRPYLRQETISTTETISIASYLESKPNENTRLLMNREGIKECVPLLVQY